MYKSPRGTVDILPEDQSYWRYIEKTALDICHLYGFQRVDTPVFEDAGLFTRSIGEGTDIVNKEMYVFCDQSGNEIALRPEGTAPVCRAYIEHGMDNRPQPVKLYYLAAIFRYERPQAGRYRQHYQFGCEAIGDSSPVLDAEIIDMAWNFFVSLGLKQLSLQVNSIGCKQCRPHYLKTLKSFYSEQVQGMCQDCQTRLEKNTLRLLDCKKPVCQNMADHAPRSSDHLCQECEEHFKSVSQYLKLLGIPFSMNHRMVRGLDYYTKTVFEIHPPEEAAQSAMGGGGRYDNLIEELGGKSTPAIGFATGMERIILNLKKQQVTVPVPAKPRLFIACIGEEAKEEGVKLSSRLRQEGISVLMAAGDKSLKAQLRQANSLSVDQVAILGDDEVRSGEVTLRDMSTSEQQRVALGKIEEFLIK